MRTAQPEEFWHLFSPNNFMPHGHCYLWRPDILWLNVGSDISIALAYYAIPFLLIYIVRKRKDLAFNWIFVMFALFIVACGTTHLVEVLTTWHPYYGLQGIVKFFTAAVSIVTAIALIRLLPRILSLPSSAELEQKNRELQSIVRDKETLLSEKDSLLKEIHHRVKNNLQVTSSLLRLQSEYIQDPHARDMFNESQNRIHSMALVHEKLYQASDLARINFPDYVESLVQLLFRSYGVDTNVIRLVLEGEKVPLSIESAVPCGLIINELISNSIKHAFPSGEKGEIRVRIETDNLNRISILVSDNGIGLPDGFNFEKVEKLGLQLVRTLVKQLDGGIEVSSSSSSSSGAHFNISFTEAKGAVGSRP